MTNTPTLHVNRAVCEQNGISVEDFVECLAIYLKVNHTECIDRLLKKGLINRSLYSDWLTKTMYFKEMPIITSRGAELINKIISESEHFENMSEDDIREIATGLKAAFPKGKCPYGNYPWAESISMICIRLHTFFRKYGDNYDKDAIIKAAQDYVTSFNGNYNYMKLLKYFIFKDKKVNGIIECESELLSRLEDPENYCNSNNNDWSSELI